MVRIRGPLAHGFPRYVNGHFEVDGHFEDVYVTLMNVYVHLRREIAGVYRHVDIMVRLQGCL